MESLVSFNIDNNPNLKMPPKLDEIDRKAKYAFYNIDFSLETQMQLARGAPAKPTARNVPEKVLRVNVLPSMPTDNYEGPLSLSYL